jgi:hypothetical protein
MFQQDGMDNIGIIDIHLASVHLDMKGTAIVGIIVSILSSRGCRFEPSSGS